MGWRIDKNGKKIKEDFYSKLVFTENQSSVPTPTYPYVYLWLNNGVLTLTDRNGSRPVVLPEYSTPPGGGYRGARRYNGSMGEIVWSTLALGEGETCLRVDPIVGSAKDFGFNSAGEMDAVAVNAWQGSQIKEVVFWYSQGKGDQPMAQLSASLYPGIADSGGVFRYKGKPYLKFSGGNFLSTDLDQISVPSELWGYIAVVYYVPNFTTGTILSISTNSSSSRSTNLRISEGSAMLSTLDSQGSLSYKANSAAISLGTEGWKVIAAESQSGVGSETVRVWVNEVSSDSSLIRSSFSKNQRIAAVGRSASTSFDPFVGGISTAALFPNATLEAMQEEVNFLRGVYDV